MISAENITVNFGERSLFENANVVFTPGFKYGIIGANGAGKSTFLKILSGDLRSDRGTVSLSSKKRLSILRQDHNFFNEYIVLDTVYQGHPKLWKVMQERADLYAIADNLKEEEGNRLGEIEGEFMELGGYTAESSAGELLSGLGVPESFHSSLMKEIPTNYKFRTLLAQALFGKPDVLLLDEPTNNLDIRSIIWLENFLNEYEGTLVIASHDRSFLNSVCSHIVDIDFGRVTVYTGDYDYYSAASKIARDHKLSAEARRKKRAEELKKFISRFGANKSKAKQATSRKKELERLMDEEEIRPSSRAYPSILFPMSRELGKDVLRIEEISKSYGELEVLRDLNFYFNAGEKVAIIGENGVGKSTLMKILYGEINPDKGNVHWGATTQRSYCPQDVKAALPKGKTLYEWLHEMKKEIEKEEIRSILGRMLFKGEDGEKLTDVLSGGESVRTILAKMMLEKANVLLLDEPTNHLDLESIESLSIGIQRFSGTVFFVSHDREFIRSVATRALELRPDKTVKEYHDISECF